MLATRTMTHRWQTVSRVFTFTSTYFPERCDFYKSREGLFTVNSHCMIGQKNSPLTKALSHK